MNRRARLEHLEQTNPLVFHREVEAFAAGSYVLCKDNIEDVIEAMYADADVIDATIERREYLRRANDLSKPTSLVDHAVTCTLFLAFGLGFAALIIFDEATIWKTTTEFMTAMVR